MAGEGDPEDAAHNMGNHLPLLPGNRLGPVPGSGRRRGQMRQWRGGAGEAGGWCRTCTGPRARDRGVSCCSSVSLDWGRGFGREEAAPKGRDSVLSILREPRTWLRGNGVKLGGERGRLRPPSIPDFYGTSSPP